MTIDSQIYIFMILISSIPFAVTDLESATRPYSLKKAPIEHIKQIAGDSHKYEIHMGGKLDGFNTIHYVETYGKFMREESKFEPNEYLIIENIGDIDIINPRIVINGRRNWFSADDILASILKAGMTDAEKAMAIYNFTSSIEVQCHENNRRVGPPYPDDNSNPSKNTFSERADPVKGANHYYCSGCSLSAANFVILCRHAGLYARAVWMCPLNVYETHCVGEVWYDKGWHLFDPEVRTFYLEEDNETVASYETIHRNPDLVTRTHDGGFASVGTKSHAEYYEKYYPPHVMPVEQWLSEMSMTLRPDEKFIWRWDHSGKYRYGDNIRNKGYLPHKLANGKMIYKPDLTKNVSRSRILSELNIKSVVEDGKFPNIHPDIPREKGYAIYKIKTAYPVVGGLVGGKFYRKSGNDVCKIYISIGKGDWIQVWSAKDTGEIEHYVAIDEVIVPGPNPAIYEYYVKYEIYAHDESSDAGIDEIYIETDLQMSSASLPSLSVGKNEIIYKDETCEKHNVLVTHGWKESSESQPPFPPEKPISPVDREQIEDIQRLMWQSAKCPDNETITNYHIQVSPREDMLNPVSPNFDRIAFSQAPEWNVPEGWLIKGKTYFWRVRAMNESGVWGEWSQKWRFTLR